MCCRLLVCDVLPLLGPVEIGPASVMVGNLVSGKRIAQASGRDLGQIEDNDQARKVCVWYHGASIFISHSILPPLSFIPHLQQTIQSHPAKNMHRNRHVFVFNASVSIHLAASGCFIIAVRGDEAPESKTEEKKCPVC